MNRLVESVLFVLLSLLPGKRGSSREYGDARAFGSSRLLDEAVLEHGIWLSADTARSRIAWRARITLGVTFDSGVWFNAVQQDAVRDGGPGPRNNVYRPSDRDHVKDMLGVYSRGSY